MKIRRPIWVVVFTMLSVGILLMSAENAMSGTWYGVDVTNMDSCANATDGQDGFARYSRKILFPKENLWIICMGSSLGAQADVITFNGTTWTGNTGVYDSYSGYDGLVQSGDSAFVLANMGSYATITKIVNTTIGVKDTIGTLTTSSGRPIATVIGGTADSIMAMYRSSAPATQLYKSDGGLANNTVWTVFDSMPTQAGWRAWERGKILTYNETDNDLLNYVSDGGMDTLSAANFSGSFANINGSTATAYQFQFAIAVYYDTVYQAWSRGDSGWIKRGVISGTVPNMTITTIDSQKVWTAADLPSPVVTTGNAGYLYTWPEFCFLRIGSHTYCFSKHWANQSNLDSIDVMISECVDGVWGSWQVFAPAVEGQALWRLHVPPTAPLSATVTLPIVAADSTGTTNRDSLLVYAGTITITSTPIGACCFEDGSCTEGTESECATAGGTYQGDSTDCTPNPCAQPPTPNSLKRTFILGHAEGQNEFWDGTFVVRPARTWTDRRYPCER